MGTGCYACIDETVFRHIDVIVVYIFIFVFSFVCLYLKFFRKTDYFVCNKFCVVPVIIFDSL